MKPKKILLVGPMPPPSGGVSVHLKRLLDRLPVNSGLTAAVFDLKRMRLTFKNDSTTNIFTILAYIFRCDIIHLHLSHPIKLFIALFGKATGKKVLITLHNLRNQNNFFTRNTIHFCYKTIFVNEPERLPLNGILLNAYIRPPKAESLPEDLKEVLHKHSTILVSLSTYSGKERTKKDLYGFDTILDAVPNASLPDKTLLILIDTTGQLRNRYREKISGIEGKQGIKILWISAEVNFPELLAKCSLYIRATRSDGDSISVREALYTGTKVLASDCVDRPAGCLTFRAGDSFDLSEKLPAALYRRNGLQHKQAECLEVLIELYTGI